MLMRVAHVLISVSRSLGFRWMM